MTDPFPFVLDATRTLRYRPSTPTVYDVDANDVVRAVALDPNAAMRQETEQAVVFLYRQLRPHLAPLAALRAALQAIFGALTPEQETLLQTWESGPAVTDGVAVDNSL